MKNIISFLLLLLNIYSVYGQTATSGESIVLKKADSLFDAGDYKQSIILYHFADSTTKKKEITLYSNNRLAECYLQQGLLDKAEQTAQKVITLATDNDKNEKATSYLLIGQVSLTKGNMEDAKNNFQKGFDLLKNEPNTTTKSKCFDQLGIYYWTRGNQQKALELLSISLDMKKEIAGENNLELANSYNNLGLVQLSDNPSKALENYKKALEIYQANYTFQHPKVGIALNNIGIIQRQLGQIEESVMTFKRALEIWTNLLGKKHSMIAFVYSNLGETYSYNREFESALLYLTKGLELYKELYGERHPEIAATYNSIGNVYLHQSKYATALDNFQRALCANSMSFQSIKLYSNPKINEYYNADLLLVSLLLKSRTLNLLHHEKTLKVRDLELELTTLLSCDSLISKLRQSRTSMKDKIELGKQSAIVYEEAILLCLELSEITLKKKYYQELAFYFSEKNKGAVLQEAIADVEAKSFAGIPDSLLEIEKELKQSITLYEQKLSDEISQEEETVYRRKLFELSLHYERHVQLLETNYPNYYNLKFNNSIPTVDQIKKSLGESELLISYYISEEKKRLLIFTFTHNNYSISNKPLPENFIKEIKSFRNSIKVMANDAYVKSAYHLYNVLLPKVQSKASRLIIIPDGKIGSIPFEALLTSASTDLSNFSSLSYLINKYSISYNYSSQLFYNSRITDNKKSTANGILLCAPVNFDGSKGLSPLPGTAKEVENISSIFEKSQIPATTLINEKANEYELKNTVSSYQIVHLATHGIVNENQPELSQLYLYPSQRNSEDGNLYCSEIYNLKINADLIVLSACQTGLGNYKKGEGIIGLTRALLYSGADNLMVSLWSVSDESTSELMINFYSNYINQTKLQFSGALRESKLKLIKEGSFSHPYYWAPFILIGK